MNSVSPKILAISSSVAVGHVGLSAVLPTLHLTGHTVAALPTILLSNHPGFGNVSGTQIAPDTLHKMLDALLQNGWLAAVDTILTGYLPSTAHVAFANAAITLIRSLNPEVRVICDPVIGDHPKGLYIDKAIADAIRQHLIPEADTILPNHFELGWLASTSVGTPDDAINAANTLGIPHVIAKSVPTGSDLIANIDITPQAKSLVTIPKLAGVPKGTGDMFSGLIAAGWTLPRASAALQSAINASLGADHLAIIPTAQQWLSAAPLDTTRL